MECVYGYFASALLARLADSNLDRSLTFPILLVPFLFIKFVTSRHDMKRNPTFAGKGKWVFSLVSTEYASYPHLHSHHGQSWGWTWTTKE